MSRPFLTVAALWRTLFVDGDPETRIEALKVGDYRNVTVRFDVPSDALAGSYRIVHHGAYYDKPHFWKDGRVVAYNGTSSTFEVTGS